MIIIIAPLFPTIPRSKRQTMNSMSGFLGEKIKGKAYLLYSFLAALESQVNK